MKVNIFYPALVFGRMPRHQKDKYIVAVYQQYLTIPEFMDSEAPVAFRQNQAYGPLDYRYLNGSLYAPTFQTVDDFFKTANSNMFHPQAGLFQKNLKLMAQKAENISDPYSTSFWPKDAKQRLKSNTPYAWTDAVTMIDYSSKIDINCNSDIDIAKYTMQALDAVSGFISIEGKLWKRAHEPCYAVWNNVDVKVNHVDGNYYQRSIDRDADAHGWGALNSMIYPASEPALCNLITKGDNDFLPIEVFMPEALSLDVDAMEIDRCSRVLIERISERLANYSSCHNVASRRETDFCLPGRGFVMAYVSLKEALQHNPFDGVHPEIGDRLSSFVDAAVSEKHPSELYRSIDPHMKYITKFLERWKARLAVKSDHDESHSKGMQP